MKTTTENSVPSEPPDDRSPATVRKGHFFRFTMPQVLLLVAVIAVLLAILAPRMRKHFKFWRLQAEANRRQAITVELSEAVREGGVARARKALEAGADPNVLFGQDRPSLLGECIIGGRVAIVELLLQYGADIEQNDRFNQAAFRGPILDGTPLYAAACCNQPLEVRAKMIRLLVAAGADPRRQSGSLNLMDSAVHQSDAELGDLLREYGLPYGPREMAAFNRLDELKRAVEESPEVLQQRFTPIWAAWPGHGPTLLAIALERANREMALFLIEAGSPLDTVVYRGETLLHLAGRGGDPELIRELVARGLDVHATDEYGDTPLSDLAGRDKPEAIAALLAADSDVNHRGVNGRTLLYSAAYSGSVNLAQMLLAAGADPTIADNKGETPLDVARTRSPPVAKLFEQAIAKKPSPAK